MRPLTVTISGATRIPNFWTAGSELKLASAGLDTTSASGRVTGGVPRGRGRLCG
jgi:hypothetical protein